MENNNNKSDNLMLMVRYAHGEVFDHAVISTKNNRFRVVRDKVPLLRGKMHGNFCRANYCVEASCNTWLLLSNASSHSRPTDLMWNPTTNETKPLLPFTASVTDLTEVWAYGVGPDPDTFSSPDYSYKVIRCRLEEGHHSIPDAVYAEVLSLGNHRWTKNITYPYQKSSLKPLGSPSLYLNGFYYWLASSDADGLAIMSFDFANDEFSDALIPMPVSTPKLKNGPGINFSSFHHRLAVVLAEFNGSLAVVVDNFDADENKVLNFDIWVWDGVGRSWARVSTFDVPAAASVFRVVGLYKNDKVLLEDTKGDLLLYNCETLEWENLGINDDSKSLLVYPYVEATRSWADVVRQKPW